MRFISSWAILRIFVLFAATLLGCSGFAMAQPHHCAKPVAAKMAQFDVAGPQIKRIVFDDIVENTRNAQIVGYEAWVDLKRCRGSVVIRLSLQCEVEEVYSRGNCNVAGLKNYP